MSEKRITLLDLDFARALEWNLFDASGRQVMKNGEMLVDDTVIDSLIHAGLFAHAPPAGVAPIAHVDEVDEVVLIEVNSVLQTINACNTSLERLLPDLAAAQQPAKQIRAIASQLQAAIDVQRDIALASIYLKQISGIYAIRHCVETAIVALIIARANGLPDQQCQSIACAALTMNVGMLDIHEQLQSRNALSAEEKQAIAHHPERSVAILHMAGINDVHWLDCVLHHHEAEDGSGYPYGLEETQVPYNARLLAMCDRYCAQVSARNYRRSLRADIALQGLQTGHPQDGQIWHFFQQEIGPYPPGTYVRLANGETGVVAHQEGESLRVRALLDANAHAVIAHHQLRDCALAPFHILHSLHEDEIDIRFHMKQIWGELASE